MCWKTEKSTNSGNWKTKIQNLRSLQEKGAQNAFKSSDFMNLIYLLLPVYILFHRRPCSPWLRTPTSWSGPCWRLGSTRTGYPRVMRRWPRSCPVGSRTCETPGWDKLGALHSHYECRHACSFLDPTYIMLTTLTLTLNNSL